jgi:N-acetylglucosaminyldiphosphoundecaprenol N-acetyl-beta-D-mannosaminyltransferase
VATTPDYIDKKRAASGLPPAMVGIAPARPFVKKPGQPRLVAAPQAARVSFGRAPVDRVTMRSATEWLLRMLDGPRGVPHLIMGPNAFLVTLAERDQRFAEALAQASLCLPDGMSVVWGSRLLGKPIPERVPGGEFMEAMCALAARKGKSVYFLGGLPGAASQSEKGFDQDPKATKDVLDRIRLACPDLLCVAFGAPKQEIWMLDHCRNLPIGAALSVGAAFDTTAGLRKRAPEWTHQLGAEWLYRLAMEPRRLWRRYLVGNAQFGAIVVREWVKLRKLRATERLLRPRAI